MAKSNKKSSTVKKAIPDKIERPERLSLAEGRDMLYEKFRTNLRVLCGSSTLSGVELSTDIGLESGSRITQLWYGRGIPTMEEAICIAKYFNTTIDDLMNKTAKITFE